MLPSLSKLSTTYANFDDLPEELIERISGMWATYRFVPGTRVFGELKTKITVPTETHSDPPLTNDVGDLFLRGMTDWESSPVVRNAAFRITGRSGPRGSNVVIGRPNPTVRVHCTHSPWGVNLMEISRDPTTPTILEARLTQWRRTFTYTNTVHDVALGDMKSMFYDNDILAICPFGESVGTTLTLTLILGTDKKPVAIWGDSVGVAVHANVD
jgi:hypothetical protein